MRVHVWDEFTRLRRVILGNIVLGNTVTSRTINMFTSRDDYNVLQDVRKLIVHRDEIEEDREGFRKVLLNCGVEVVDVPKMEISDLHKFKSLPMGSVRDLLFTYGDVLHVCATRLDCRRNESKFFMSNVEEFEKNVVHESNGTITLGEEFKDVNDSMKFTSNEDLRSHNPTTSGAVDGANFLKIGNRIFCNVSDVHMIGGLHQMENAFPKGTIVKAMSVCQKHIDGTMMILRPGLILLHGGMRRGWDQALPTEFHSWDKIFASDSYVSEILGPKLTKGNTDINWLVIDEHTVIVPNYMLKKVSQELKKYKIEAIPVKFGYQHLWGGGLHCTTLDIERDGVCVDYFS
jgi:N-dimethylarginine dimethylaminohydrolase